MGAFFVVALWINYLSVISKSIVMASPVRSFLILAFIFALFFAYRWYDHTYNPITLTEDVIRPDILLENTKQDAREHAYERSKSQVIAAIAAIRKIEPELDERSKELLESSIKDLLVIQEELDNDTLVLEDMNYAFSKALNALTIAELRVSEFLLESDHSDKAMVALKYGMYHLKNTLRFTEGHKQEYEAHIYDEIDSLLESPHLDHDEMIMRLETMIGELDSLVEGRIR